MTAPIVRSSPRNSKPSPTNLRSLIVGALAGFLVATLLSAATNNSSKEPSVNDSGSGILLSPNNYRNDPFLSDQFRGKQVTDVDDDWQLIHVYVGSANVDDDTTTSGAVAAATRKQIADASAIPNDYFYSNPHWFSQCQQDYVIFKLLGEKKAGYFVDFAANDAVRISNTYALETYHEWRGLCIEPNPIYWSGLAYRKHCQTVAAVVGQRTGEELAFKFPKEKAPQGGLIGPQFDNKAQPSSKSTNKLGEEAQMRFTVTIADIFERFQVPKVIDYLSLDVEGAETFVMESFPFERYRFNALTVERADDRLCDLLMANGYKKLKKLRNWGETLWIHSSIEGSIDKSALEIDTEHYKYREKVV